MSTMTFDNATTKDALYDLFDQEGVLQFVSWGRLAARLSDATGSKVTSGDLKQLVSRLARRRHVVFLPRENCERVFGTPVLALRLVEQNLAV